MHVRIFKPTKNAMQSPRAGQGAWCLHPHAQTRKTPNALMGWISSSDTTEQITLFFDTAEDAIHYAQQRGWTYTVSPDHTRTVRPKSYAANFTHNRPVTP